MKKCLSQEWLKLVACVTMLLDHLGIVFFPQFTIMRAIGRIAFPIYAFLLVEGAVHTQHKKQYALRLAIGILLAEPIFDRLFSGFFHDWTCSNVMVTLFLGYIMILWMERMPKAKVMPVLLAAVVSELFSSDYGMWGIIIIALFYLTHESEQKLELQLLSMFAISYAMGRSIQMCAVMALLPIYLYSGKKLNYSKAVQWIFYLFYPVHLLIIFVVNEII